MTRSQLCSTVPARDMLHNVPEAWDVIARNRLAHCPPLINRCIRGREFHAASRVSLRKRSCHFHSGLCGHAMLLSPTACSVQKERNRRMASTFGHGRNSSEAVACQWALKHGWSAETPEPAWNERPQFFRVRTFTHAQREENSRAVICQLIFVLAQVTALKSVSNFLPKLASSQ